MSAPQKALRPDLAAIAAMIRPGARVLDVGCGDGALLEYLKAKNVDGRGIEIAQANVNACVARGLAVVQGDADTDLVDYPAQVFDAVILSQTIQATEKPRVVLDHLLRIGRRESALAVFRVPDDTESLTQFVHRCRAHGVPPAEILQCLEHTDLARHRLAGGARYPARAGFALHV